MLGTLRVHSLAAVAACAVAAGTSFTLPSADSAGVGAPPPAAAAALAPGRDPAAGATARWVPGSLRSGAAGDSCPWVNSRAPITSRVAQVMAKLTLQEKIALVHGAPGSKYAGWIPAIPRLCVPALKLEDGPGGVADGMEGVTQLPAPVAVASSWDTSLAFRYGTVIAAEEWGKGANVNLGPTVNIVRDPRWGRAFEAYGEDPFLTGALAAAEIAGVQSRGVLAQVKHWVAYNQETFRNTPADDVIVDRRSLREIYMPQFQAAIRLGPAGLRGPVGASSVMCAYSTVNGAWACEDAWTQDTVLKGTWRFPGFITSDWGATHGTAAFANGGLDLQMPDTTHFGAPLEAAVLAGQVPMSRLNDMVRRILTEEFRFHLFERAQPGGPDSVVTDSEDAAAARSAAEQGIVLLKNAGDLLPLDPARVHSIAVIGSDGGKDAMTGGGGSAYVTAPYVITPFQGIEGRAGTGIVVRYAQGDQPANAALPAVPSSALAPSAGQGEGAAGSHGLTAQFYNNMTLSGEPVLTRVDTAVGANWHDQPAGPGVSANKWSAKWTGTITAPTTGEYTFSLTSDDGSRLFINGARVIDQWQDQGPTTVTAQVALTGGQPAQIEVDFYQNEGGDSVSLGWRPPSPRSLLDQAVALAESSDVAIVFASDFESEGADLKDIELPGEQNRLIGAVAAANHNTIVVLNTGSAVTMPWVDSVKAVLEAWYPGQEYGHALAAVLFGDVDPAAKLPVTFPVSLADGPAATPARWPGVDGRVEYSEGLLVGYRWYDARHVAPLFPFGFGLSYTTFGFGHIQVAHGRGRTVTVSADVTNTGARPGADVVQLYVGFPAAAGEPPWQLKGFEKVQLAPGAKKRVTFALGPEAFAHWDGAASRWRVSAGRYRIGVGDSSVNLPLTAEVSPRPGPVD